MKEGRGPSRHRVWPVTVMTMTEDVGAMFQKGLSEWWNEETEYVFQRIERWAAYARGYNRLRSQRLSRGRLTMQVGQESRWSISSNKLIIDDSSWSPRFHTLKRSRRKSRPEETKINCCGTFNYQSNSNLDSTCLETYRYDHSIYFKTIGDLKNSKKEAADTKNEQEDRISISSKELVEWDASDVTDYIANQLLVDGLGSNKDVFTTSNPDQDGSGMDSVTWCNVDLTKLSISEQDTSDGIIDEQNNEHLWTIPQSDEENNNYMQEKRFVADVNLKNQAQLNDVSGHCVEELQNEDGIGFWETKRSRRASRKVKQPPIVGDNDIAEIESDFELL